MSQPTPVPAAEASPSTAAREIRSLRDLSPQQKKSGLAAWLGWFFDGMDMHLYTLVAVPFVAELMRLESSDPRVGQHGAIINAGFLVGWALGGAFFGRVGDLVGRSRALCFTILTYACFTSLGAAAQTWWQLLIFRFLSALGVGGEWAVGASLLSETWPKKWRPWIAATLQTGVNLGILGACLAGYLLEKHPPRWIFLVGALPALLVFWIRRAVPEPEEWTNERRRAASNAPGVRELFRGPVARVTWRALAVCAVSLTAHWTLMYWHQAHVRNLPEVVNLSAAEKNHAGVVALFVLMASSIIGNYLAGLVARFIGFRRAVAVMLAAYFLAMMGAYGTPHSRDTLMTWLWLVGAASGVFALFTMCLPPLFPTLLRTTGAGFCYNFGRIVAASGTVFFGLFTKVGDYRLALFYAGFLFIPATLFALLLPDVPDEGSPASPVE
jgi:MFS family permease